MSSLRTSSVVAWMGVFGIVGIAGVSITGCKSEPPAPPLSTLSPKPLPKEIPSPPTGVAATGDEREAAFEIAPAPVHGDPLPKRALRVELRGESVLLEGQPFDVSAPDAAEQLRARFSAAGDDDKVVLLVPDEDTYLLQAVPMLAMLDAVRARVHLLHPDGRVAFRVTLSSERDFQRWLDQPRSGQVRVIHRADGFELQSNLGKLPGADPNGPSVPLRGGQWDLARLRAGIGTLKERFNADTESCIVPSFGMELATVSRALTAWYTAPGSRLYPELCLVYPLPRTGDADAGTGTATPAK